MITRKESQEKQESNRESYAASPPALHQPAVIDAFLIRKDNEKKIHDPRLRLLYNFFQIKAKGKLADVCLNAVRTEIMPGYADFRAETENRAKTFELAFENN